jgi:hypothetical protein
MAIAVLSPVVTPRQTVGDSPSHCVYDNLFGRVFEMDICNRDVCRKTALAECQINY